MLEVLKAKKLFETAVAVVRYFGGIKLGAGGLVRAYSSGVAENLDGADIRSLEVCARYTLFVDYTGIDGVQKYLSTHTCSLISTDYGENVRFEIAVKKTGEEPFIKGLIDYMQGRIKIERGEEYYSAFELDK
jgi:putative IMPACT (imprinted ancient) family translation regulator